MDGQYVLRCLDDLNPLAIATDEGEYGALAVAPHAADERDIDVNGLLRLEPCALNPEAHGVLLFEPPQDKRRGGAV
jgi:hypothetical protein